jgi:hypothetical protein
MTDGTKPATFDDIGSELNVFDTSINPLVYRLGALQLAVGHAWPVRHRNEKQISFGGGVDASQFLLCVRLGTSIVKKVDYRGRTQLPHRFFHPMYFLMNYRHCCLGAGYPFAKVSVNPGDRNEKQKFGRVKTRLPFTFTQYFIGCCLDRLRFSGLADRSES